MVIVEVLSPSTEGIDRRRKVMDYRQVPSVEAILLIAAEAQHVEVQRRVASGWTVEDLIGQAELSLAACSSPIPLDAIYGDLLAPEAGT